MDMRKKALFILVFGLLCFIGGEIYAQGFHGDHDLGGRVASLVFQLGVILFAAWTGSIVFEKLKFPPVLGEVVAGMIIGPFLLGSLPLPGFVEGVFPRLMGNFPITAELYSFTAIAAIILLFLVGLETDIETFLSYSVAGTAVGIGGAVFSFVFGDLVAVWFSQSVFGLNYGFGHPIPLFLGVVSTATSVGISARLLSEKQKMGSPEGVTILSAAVIDDVIGIIILAVVIGVVKSGHVEWHTVSLTAAKAVGLWIGCTVIGLFAARHLSGFLKNFKDRTSIAVMSLALALMLSGIFEKSGLAMIIGAYVMGLSLSKTDISYIIQDKLSVLHRFFMPVFFCVMGMFIDLKQMAAPHIMIFWIVYVVVAFLSKFLGCSLPALLFNFNARGAARVGMGMIPRGEVALIIAGIGLSAGIIPREIFSVAVIMTFFTTLIAPPLLDRMLSVKGKVLRKKPVRSDQHIQVKYAMPNPETAELILGRVISDFEEEGFYVHCMQLSDSVYQIRKNDIFITLKYAPEELVFDCLEEDEHFIHTLFYEVLAEFENLMKNIQNLEDKAKIGKKIFSGGNGKRSNGKKSKTINIAKIISPLAVETDLKGASKHEILEALTDLLLRSGQINTLKRQEVLNDILEREVDMSTGMQEGLAFPHAKTMAIDHLISAVGIVREGVDFDSLDKKPTRIFVVTLAPKNASESYLHYLSEMSKFLQDEENRNKLLEARCNTELYKILVQ